MLAPDKDYIPLYRALVEEKLMLGQDGKLKQRDFEYLITVIEEKSRIKLSVSTLKRFWRGDFAQVPHPTTLDALAHVLEFSAWQDFKAAFAHKVSPRVEKTSRKKIPASLYVIAGFAISMIGFLALQAFNKEDGKQAVKIPFTADKAVTVGVPATVLFNYDFRNVEAKHFFIQPSEDSKLIAAVNPNDHYFPATYYEPGFHWARLMADDSIVTFASVHIQTNGWFPLVKYSLTGTPIYLDPAATKMNGTLSATAEVLNAAQIDPDKNFYVQFFNIRDFENVHSDNFEIETNVKAPGTTGEAEAQLTIVTEEDAFIVPLFEKASDSLLKVGEVELKYDSLAAFKTSLAEWQNLKIKTQNKKASISLNGKIIREIAFERNFGNIKGLIYTFKGAGAVDFVRVKNGAGQTVYEDLFD